MPIQLKNKRVTIGIGMLSWYIPKTVDHTQSSFSGRNIFSLFDHCRIYCQEITTADHVVVDKYGFEIMGNDDNQGIYGGIKALFEWMPENYVLFIENDSADRIKKRRIKNDAADIFRMRHRRQPREA